MSEVNQLLDAWDICPYEYDADELFSCFKNCTEVYLKNYDLTTKTIVMIVQDLREYINPQNDPHLSYFTDIICDCILGEFKGINSGKLPVLLGFIASCENRVYLKV